MKKLHYLLLALVTITFISCGGEKNRYQPIQGYKGMVKRIVSYNYENDFQKNKIISKYGVLIPKYIKEYNKYGNETMNVIIDLPDDDDEQVCVIYIDSISYDKKQKQESLVRYTIYTNTNEIMYYNDPQRLIKSNTTFTQKEVEETHYTRKGDSESRITISTLSFETKSLDNISKTIQNVIKKRLEYLGDSFLNETYIPDTTSVIHLKYENDKIIHEKHQGYLSSKEITNYYDKDLLLSQTAVTENDTIITTYSYKDGYLSEVKTDDNIKRYDKKGRLVYNKNNNREEINIFKGDSIEITSTSSSIGHFIYFSKVNQDSLNIFSISLNLADENRYADDVIMQIEKFANNEISQEKIMNEIEQIIYKIDDSNYNSFTSTIYTNFDTHNNPLKIELNRTTMTNNYSMFSSPSLSKYKYYLDKKVIKSESRDITEREIEYY